MSTQVKLQPPGGMVDAPETGDVGSAGPWPTTLIAAFSTACLALLAVGLLGWAAGSDPAKWSGLVLYALIGFGAAWIVVLRPENWQVPVLAAPVGLVFCILVGFLLIETRTWTVGPDLFGAFLALTAAIHSFVLVRFALTRALLKGLHHLRSRLLSLMRTVGSTSWIVAALSVLGVLMCLVSAAQLNNFDPTKPSAFFGAVSPAWYVGALCIIGAVVLGVASKQAAALAAACAVVALELVMNMSAALAYSEPHSSWAARHVGVTQYMMHYGVTNRKIDIYQSWPGLFAGVGWVCKAIGNLDPMEIARWWPPVIGLATVVVFQRFARGALGSSRRAWIATAILIIGNTIGQDYYSPQATGYLLAITFYALAYRGDKEPRRVSLPDWILLAAISVAVAVTHQLSPYMMTGVMVVLALFGHARSRLLPAITLLPAAAWALANFSVVRRYFHVSQVGHVFTNLLPPGYSKVAEITKSHLIRIVSFGMAADAAIIGLIAVAVLLHRRTKSHLVWALCAFSGAGLFLANSYGNEGSFRVVLFALPWLGLLFADWRGMGKRRLATIPYIAIPILFGLYLFANLGLDYIRAVRPGDVSAIRTFERTAPANSKLYVLGVSFTPLESSYRYWLMRYRYYPYIDNRTNSGATFNPNESFDDFMLLRVPPRSLTLRVHHIYVLGAAESEAALEQYNLTTQSNYQGLVKQFENSRDWKLVKKTSTAELFELQSYINSVGRPTISGQTRVNQYLVASKGVWATLKPLTYSYQWERCAAAVPKYKPQTCSPISGATGSTYQVSFADQGSRLAVLVTAQDSRGVDAISASRVTGTVRVVPPRKPIVRHPSKKQTLR
jgi:hypothetical protein